MTRTVADDLAALMADLGIGCIFGVISIHNMPLIDAIDRAGRIRFVPARGEAGAMNMADGFARVSGGIGVCLSSTGTAAGNAAGAQTEALVAGSRVLHVTSQVDTGLADRDRAAIHDVPRQPQMLGAVSKAVFRAWRPAQAAGALIAAVSACRSAPAGPVSLELPIDVQRAASESAGESRAWIAETPPPRASEAAIAALAERLQAARRPILWLGGGAHGASGPATALARRGIAIVTSTHGRAVVAEDHPGSLGAFNMTPEAAALYESCDLMIVAGSRLRGNETRNNALPLPPLAQIDVDASQLGRNYPVALAIHGDAADALSRLDAALPAEWRPDPELAHDVAVARARSEGRLRAALGPYAVIADALAQRVPAGRHPWVRDVTIANSTFGNRYVPIAAPHLGVHALGGGIGQGLAMGIGAALAAQMAGGANAVVLSGDGGLQLGLAELATMAETEAPMVLIVMNDRGYGVIANIQDAQYGGRRVHSALLTPDFATLCRSVGLDHEPVRAVQDFAPALDRALARPGPRVIEVDMTAIGPFAEPFAGPPAGAAQRS